MKWVIKNGETSYDIEVDRRRDGFEVAVDGTKTMVDVERLDGALASLIFTGNGRSFSVAYERSDRRRWRVAVATFDYALDVLTPLEAVESESESAAKGPSKLEAPIPGKVVAVKVQPGDEVEPGQTLVILEAMKMENDLAVEQAGVVGTIHVETGMIVETGQLLVELE